MSILAYSQTSFNKKELEKDIKKIAEYLCKMNELVKNPAENSQKIKELAETMQKFSEEMEKKYKVFQDNEEIKKTAQNIIKEELKKCGADEILRKIEENVED